MVLSRGRRPPSGAAPDTPQHTPHPSAMPEQQHQEEQQQETSAAAASTSSNHPRRSSKHLPRLDLPTAASPPPAPQTPAPVQGPPGAPLSLTPSPAGPSSRLEPPLSRHALASAAASAACAGASSSASSSSGEGPQRGNGASSSSISTPHPTGMVRRQLFSSPAAPSNPPTRASSHTTAAAAAAGGVGSAAAWAVASYPAAAHGRAAALHGAQLPDNATDSTDDEGYADAYGVTSDDATTGGGAAAEVALRISYAGGITGDEAADDEDDEETSEWVTDDGSYDAAADSAEEEAAAEGDADEEEEEEEEEGQEEEEEEEEEEEGYLYSGSEDGDEEVVVEGVEALFLQEGHNLVAAAAEAAVLAADSGGGRPHAGSTARSARRSARQQREADAAAARAGAEAGPGGFSFAAAWLHVWLRYIGREHGGARFFLQDPENLKQVLHLARSSAPRSAAAAVAACSATAGELRELSLTVLLTAAREFAGDRDYGSKFLEGLFDGGLGESLCSHLAVALATIKSYSSGSSSSSSAGSSAGSSSSSSSSRSVKGFDASTCQLASALVATLADQPGFEPWISQTSWIWEEAQQADHATAGGSGTSPARGRSGTSARRGRRQTEHDDDRGGFSGYVEDYDLRDSRSTPLPALHRLLLDLATSLTDLVISTSHSSSSHLGVAGATAASGGGGGGARVPWVVEEEGLEAAGQLLEPLMLVSHALCMLMEHGSRAVRAAMRRRLPDGDLGLGESALDEAVRSGRIDWLLLSWAAIRQTPESPDHGPERSENQLSVGSFEMTDKRMAALVALPVRVMGGVMRLVGPQACSCLGAHRWVNAAAIGIVAQWVAVLADEPQGGGSSGDSSGQSGGQSGGSSGGQSGQHGRMSGVEEGRRAMERLRGQLRRQLLDSFLAVGGCARLAALLDDCHDEADKAPTFQSRESQRSHKRGVAAQALQVVWQLLRYYDARSSLTDTSPQRPTGRRGGTSLRTEASGPLNLPPRQQQQQSNVRSNRQQQQPEDLATLARSALSLAGDWLSWVCVSSLEALGTNGAAAVGRAITELCDRVSSTGAGHALGDLDPCWRAVRVLGDERTGVPAQLLGAHVVCSYPAVVKGEATNPYIDSSVVLNSVRRLLLLADEAQPQHAATVARAALLLARCFRLGPGDVRLLSDSARNPGGAGSEDGSNDGEEGAGEGQREGVVQLVLQTHPQAFLALLHQWLTSGSPSTARWASTALGFLEERQLLGSCLVAACGDAHGDGSAMQAGPHVLHAPHGARASHAGHAAHATSHAPHAGVHADGKDEDHITGEAFLCHVAAAASWRLAHDARGALSGAGASSSGAGARSGAVGCAVAVRQEDERRYGAPFVLAGLALLARVHALGRGDGERGLVLQLLEGAGSGAGSGSSGGRQHHHGRRRAAAALSAALAALDVRSATAGAGGAAAGGAPRRVFAAALGQARALTAAPAFLQRAQRMLWSESPAAARGAGGSGAAPQIRRLERELLLPLHAALDAAAEVAGVISAVRRRTRGGRGRRQSGARERQDAAAAIANAVAVAKRWSSAVASGGQLGSYCAGEGETTDARPDEVMHATEKGDLGSSDQTPDHQTSSTDDTAASQDQPEAGQRLLNQRMRQLHDQRRRGAVTLFVGGGSSGGGAVSGAAVTLPLAMVRRCTALDALCDMAAVEEEADYSSAYGSSAYDSLEVEGAAVEGGRTMAGVPLPAVGALAPEAAGKLLRVAVAFDALLAASSATRAAAADAAGGGSASSGGGGGGGGDNEGGSALVGVERLDLEGELLVAAFEEHGGLIGQQGTNSSSSGATAAGAAAGAERGAARVQPQRGQRWSNAGSSAKITKDDLVDLWMLADFLGYDPLFRPIKWLLSQTLLPNHGAWALSRMGGHPLAPDLLRLYARALVGGWGRANRGVRCAAWALICERPVAAQAAAVAVADVLASWVHGLGPQQAWGPGQQALLP